MATVTARSVLTSSRRGLDTLASKVKTAVAKSTGHKVESVTVYLGVEKGLDIASSVVVEVYVEAEGYPYPAYADPKAVLAGVKKATGCRMVREIGSSTVSNPKGEVYQFDCSVSVSGSTRVPAVAFV